MSVKPEKCWYCEFFVSSDSGAPNQGECRKNAPTGFCSQVICSEGDQTQIFPQIFNGADESCGEFVPATEERDDPA